MNELTIQQYLSIYGEFKINKITDINMFLHCDITTFKYVIKYIISRNFDIHTYNEYIFRGLCNEGTYDTLKWFLEYCVSINSRVNYDIKYVLINSSFIKNIDQIIKCLLEYSEKNNYCWHTGLDFMFIIVCTRGNIELVKYIVEYYFKHNMRFKFNNSTILVSRTYHYCSIIKENIIINYVHYLYKHKYNGYILTISNVSDDISYNIINKFIVYKNIKNVCKYKYVNDNNICITKKRLIFRYVNYTINIEQIKNEIFDLMN